MKKILSCLLAVAMMASMAACGNSSTPASSSAPAPAPAPGSSTAAPAGGTEVKKLEGAIAEQPALLTSVGQSADYEMVKVMLDKGEIKYNINGMATPDDIGDNKTLVLAVGGSSKGLGAAGIDADQELERVGKLIDAAKEKGLKVIALHIGGEARRGELSDKFVAPVINKADYVIVVKEGNKDGLFNTLCSEAGIPMDEVASMGEVLAPLKASFK